MSSAAVDWSSGCSIGKQSVDSWLLMRIDAHTGAPDQTFGSHGAVASSTIVAAVARVTSMRIVALGWRESASGSIVGSSRLQAFVGLTGTLPTGDDCGSS